MYTTKRFEIIIAIFGLVWGISGVANGNTFGDHTGTTVKYDRRDLAAAGGGGGGAAGGGGGGAAAGGAAAGGGGAAAGGGGGAGPGDIDIGKLGAKGDGATDVTQIVQKAWDDACQSGGKKLIIPAGIWLVGPLRWFGPCKGPAVTVVLQGTLKAKPDPGAYPDQRQINVWRASLNLIGGGTIDGAGEVAQKNRKQGDKPLPDSMEIGQSPNVVMEGIKFVNAKGFNLKVIQCDNFKANGLSITAGGETLNTDGIHLARSHGVSITNCQIGVGDDCISIGDDSVDVVIRNIQCGPGHGISIGSLGKFPDEKDVRNIEVSNVTFLATSNGARIKTFHNTPAMAVSNITFSDVNFKDGFNPIVIDQNYNSGFAAATGGASKVKISGVTFKNFKGTTMGNLVVSLNCSSATPCDGITLDGVAITYTGNNTVNKGLATSCQNAKASFVGSTVPQCGGQAPGGGAAGGAAGGGAAGGAGGGAAGGGGGGGKQVNNKENNKESGGGNNKQEGGGNNKEEGGGHNKESGGKNKKG